MKKTLALLVVLISLLAPMAAQAATTSDQVKQLNLEMAQQKQIYEKYADQAADYLKFIITQNPSFDETLEYQKKIEECRKAYSDAADKMQEIRIKLYELNN